MLAGLFKKQRKHAHSISLQGRKEHNEDALVCDDRGIYIIADGCSGDDPTTAARAAGICHDYLLRRRAWRLGGMEREQALAEAAAHTNTALYTLSRERGRGMRTTLDTVVIGKDGMSGIHIGDAQVYAITGASVRQLTSQTTSFTEHFCQERESGGIYLARGPAHTIGGDRQASYTPFHAEDWERIAMLTDGFVDVIPPDALNKALTMPVNDVLPRLTRYHESPDPYALDAFLRYSQNPLHWLTHPVWTAQLPGYERWAARELCAKAMATARQDKQRELLMESMYDPRLREIFRERARQSLSMRDNASAIIIERAAP